MEHSWEFLSPPTQGKYHLLNSGDRRYPFELALPGGLPETLEGNAYRGVAYKLKAVAERSTFMAHNITDTQPVRLLRQLHCDPLPARIASADERLCHEVVTSHRAVRRGDRVPVDVYLMARQPGWRLRYITGVMKEYTTFLNSLTETRILRFFRDEETGPHFRGVSMDEHLYKPLEFVVPRTLRSIQCDTSNGLFRISHKLQFTISLINDSGDIAEIRECLPIMVADDTLVDAMQESAEALGDLILPTYEDAQRCAPYIPALEMHLDSPMSSTASTPTEDFDDWLAMPQLQAQPPFCQEQLYSALCRVPSYHTALRSTDSLIPDGLPSYDALVA